MNKITAVVNYFTILHNTSEFLKKYNDYSISFPIQSLAFLNTFQIIRIAIANLIKIIKSLTFTMNSHFVLNLDINVILNKMQFEKKITINIMRSIK